MKARYAPAAAFALSLCIGGLLFFGAWFVIEILPEWWMILVAAYLPLILAACLIGRLVPGLVTFYVRPRPYKGLPVLVTMLICTLVLDYYWYTMLNPVPYAALQISLGGLALPVFILILAISPAIVWLMSRRPFRRLRREGKVIG